MSRNTVHNRLIRPDPVRPVSPEERFRRREQHNVQLQGATNATGSNSDIPWGLMGDARPPTPSEGRAQYYHRVGPADQQNTRTYPNGTSLTFGPNDLIAEPAGAAFDSQFNEINQAVRDLQLSNGQGPVNRNTPAGNNVAYSNFRIHRIDPSNLQQVRYPDGSMYRVVPSQYASVEVIPHVRSLVRHLSERPGEAYTGDSTDTRFGDNRGLAMSQDSARTLSNEKNALLKALLTHRSSAVDNGSPDVTSITEDIEGPIYTSRGTFYPGPREPGYPPGYPKVPSGPRNFGKQQYQSHGYGQSTAASSSSNVPRQSEDIQRGRRIERDPDPKYYKSHRKTQRRAAIEWGLELDQRNQEDRRRGETILGGDIDSGEVHTFWRFGVPLYEKDRTPIAAAAPAPAPAEAEATEGFATPRALSPRPAHPQLMLTEASPLPSAQPSPRSLPGPSSLSSWQSSTLSYPHQASASSSLPPMQPYTGHLTSRRTSAPLPNTDRFHDSSFSRILDMHDQNRLSQSPTLQAASEGRSSSADSSENTVLGEQAGTVRALSKSREGGRRLYEK
ncbi:hypothetical protein BKA61DRAFT_655458 [Leptodontidium sp. MPI-SDFR-AT-0119]|nr:hypothetical protein BKA61DRAFT_655458 [Leptodontidium sp. MPI-SDFR-AT-0119]